MQPFLLLCLAPAGVAMEQNGLIGRAFPRKRGTFAAIVTASGGQFVPG
jgi:hypothetical protein